MAIDFEASSSQYLTRADDALLDLSSAVTLAAWVNPETLNTGDIRIVVAKGNDTGDNSNYELHLRDAASNGSAGIWLVWGNGGFRWLETTAQNVVSTGSWQHVAAGYDGGTTKKVWYDGSSQAITDTSGNTAIVPNGEALEVGRRGNNSTATAGYFDGLIAEVGVWDAVLTDDEVASLAKGVSPLAVRPQSLVAYWPLYGRGAAEPEYVNGLGLTPTNAPAAAAHPRVYYPWQPQLPFAAAGGGGGGGSIPIFSHHYRQMAAAG